ncbi:MAG: N-acetylmuramoyl-L-alanine amidase [Candidatus Melainabacteria bacterium]|nr:N-acetylmuramoyl-L-alanine amidase [Candidatus Melainabacteria bacterium]
MFYQKFSGNFKNLVRASLSQLAVVLLAAGTSALLIEAAPEAQARSKSASRTSVKKSGKVQSRRVVSSRSSSRSRARGRTASRRARGGSTVAHHGRHGKVAHHAPKTRYAYPIGLFMPRPPVFDTSPLSESEAERISDAFKNGTADGYAARLLVRAGVVKYHPLRGGIFWRREPVKYIVMHSTETGIPISAVRVIESWSSMGIRHPGAQYVVERDGTIYQAVDPDLATVHVNIFKTLPGINNDNSIGIEMNHTGSQDYPPAMMNSVIKLVAYLQNRYNVQDGNIITHRYAQQGDHTDPVHFDWEGFLATKNGFKNQAIAYRSGRIKEEARSWKSQPEPAVNTYLKIHQPLDVKAPKVDKSALPQPLPVKGPAPADSANGGPAPLTVPEASPASGSAPESVSTPEPTKTPENPLETPSKSTPSESKDKLESKQPKGPASGAVHVQAVFKPASPSQLNRAGRLLPAPENSSLRFYPPGYFSQQANLASPDKGL